MSPCPRARVCVQAIKLQVNSGNGGSFPLHFDSDEALDGRKVTCIFYLNPRWADARDKPGWPVFAREMVVWL